MKYFFKMIINKNFLSILLVTGFAVLAARSLIFQSGYFKMHDDLQMMRQLEMEKCFSDFQIPCRWVPDMGYGFGFPLFNFYPPLPYLIGEIFRIIGLSYIVTVKLNFSLSILVSGVGMYFLAKEFFGRIGGVLSAVFYVWAPYHAVDVYVRGALNEAWALAFFPLIFWAAHKLVTVDKQKLKQWIIFLAVAYSLLLMSHNLMVMIFTPFLGVWVLLHLWRENAWSRLPYLIISGIWSFGLAAFFTLPALVENNFTQVKSQLVGYYDYTAHFVSLRQLLVSRFWGYGGSVWVDAEDGMSFQIGHLHYLLSIGVGLILVIRVIRVIRLRQGFGGLVSEIKKDRLLLIGGLMLSIGWFSAYLTHLRSIWIYQAIPQLRYIQFPWRFLTIVIFTFSFVIGILPSLLHSGKRFFDFANAWLRMTMTSFLIILLVIVNWNYFKPEGGKMGRLTDEQKFSGAAWELQQNGGINDYLPIYAKEAPREPQTNLAEVMEGEGEIEGAEQGTYWGKFNANIESDEALLRINTFYFPGWRVFMKDGLNAPEIKTFIPEEERWGRMWIKLPKGEHLVYAQIFNTPIRTVSNLISFISWGFIISTLFWRKRFSLMLQSKGE